MKEKIAWIFPGQGAQYVGMGADICRRFPIARKIFERAGELLGLELVRLCFEGPAETLNATDISQVAIFTHSAALLELAKKHGIIGRDGLPDAVAGLSMGEYTALYAAGALSFEDALLLVRRRGQLMQQAARQRRGIMVAIIGLSRQQVEQICRQAAEGQVLVPANFNCPGQIVISGENAACQRAMELAEQAGARQVRPLAVAGAFHSPLMEPAREPFTEALGEVEFHLPLTAVACNVTGGYHEHEPRMIRRRLVEQLLSPILWQQNVETMVTDGVTKFYELGPGRVLTGLLKRIDRTLQVRNISTAEAFDSL